MSRSRGSWILKPGLWGAAFLVVASLSFGEPLADPGNLVGFRDRVDEELVFSVEGSVSGSVWGTGIYTDDSPLAVAAVHSGVLWPGERGLVRVRILEGQDSYVGSVGLGVRSYDYGRYGGAYQVLDARTPAIEVLPDPVALQSYREQVGERFTFLVQGADSGSAWGSGPYTDDSRLAKAAVHAGAVALGEYGVVEVTITGANESYAGSERNGIATSDYGAWPGSYEVRAVARGLVFADSSPLSVRRDPGNLTGLRNDSQKRFWFRVTGASEGALWGTDVYTDDSSLDVACVHAGILRAGETGVIEVVILDGRESYEGSTQNGVTSSSYGSWSHSYTVRRVE